MTTVFDAAVRYEDWKGTAAADGTDSGMLHRWLEQKGHMASGDFLVGVTLHTRENRRDEHHDPVYVTILVARGSHDDVKARIESGPLTVKRIDEEMALAEFFGFFKRFSVAISIHGMLEKREYESDLD